jgi:hypothetical protein
MVTTIGAKTVDGVNLVFHKHFMDYLRTTKARRKYYWWYADNTSDNKEADMVIKFLQFKGTQLSSILKQQLSTFNEHEGSTVKKS